MTASERPVRAASRITGLDVARGLAVLGMFAAHVLLVDEFDWATPMTWGSIADGRSAATFAVLAGISIAIVSGGMSPAHGPALTRARLRIIVRAGVIFLLGAFLTSLGTNVYIILEYYALMFVMALPVLRWTPRRLFIAAGVLVVVAPVAQLVLTRIATDAGLERYPPVYYLVTGNYPAIVWFVFILVGIGVGRLRLRERATAVQLLGAGLGLTVVGYTLGSIAAVVAPAGSSDIHPGQIVAGDGLFDLAPLLTALPHTGTPFELVGATGFALTLIALCLLLARPLRVVLAPLAATGSMALSAYTAQIIALAIIGDDYWQFGNNNAGLYLSLALGTLIACTVWARLLGRGPLERLLSWLSNRAADAATGTPGARGDESAPVQRR
jgi:uncharacterized membrane protein YeiB